MNIRDNINTFRKFLFAILNIIIILPLSFLNVTFGIFGYDIIKLREMTR